MSLAPTSGRGLSFELRTSRTRPRRCDGRMEGKRDLIRKAWEAPRSESSNVGGPAP